MTKRKTTSNGDGGVGLGPLTLDDLGLDAASEGGGASSRAPEEEPKHFGFKKFKNSLDSDEEDDEIASKRNDVLHPDDLEGQEDGTIDRDGEIRITPFNMKDELEEGHFDKEGTFIFDKTEEIKDHWLDNIDWIKIKEQHPRKNIDSDSDSDTDSPPVDVIECYREMLTLMQPKEIVLKAIKRMGGSSKMSASSRWIKKKTLDSEQEAKEAENREKMLRLTTLADKVLSTGDMDIYQQTYERLTFLVRAKEKAKLTTEAESDMFGDDFDAKEVAASDAEKITTAEADEEGQGKAPSEEAMWEFKWEDNEEAPVYGPHSTSEMSRWVDEGYFKDGVLVRRVNEANANFYSSKRIDFELYM